MYRAPYCPDDRQSTFLLVDLLPVHLACLNSNVRGVVVEEGKQAAKHVGCPQLIGSL